MITFLAAIASFLADMDNVLVRFGLIPPPPEPTAIVEVNETPPTVNVAVAATDTPVPEPTYVPTDVSAGITTHTPSPKPTVELTVTKTPTNTLIPPTSRPRLANTLTPAPDAPQSGEKRTIEGIDFVYVPTGRFIMGKQNEEQDVNVDAFWIMQYELTNVQFRGFVDGDGYTNAEYWTDSGWEWKTENSIASPEFWNDSRANAFDQPLVGVSWYEANAFSVWLSDRTGHEFRLPTEAEWEKAARSTDGRRFPWGNEWDPSRANYCDVNCTNTWYDESGNDKYQYAASVGTFDNASPYNAYDMAGNVGEWTGSLRHIGPNTRLRVTRGGGYSSPQVNLQTAQDSGFSPEGRSIAIGIRLVLPSNDVD